ncbi:MAG: hypothetical protein MJ211_06630 [Bacteroidales bacterium]|nr:hypothetical protein [Bacteroidales bacterium]
MKKIIIIIISLLFTINAKSQEVIEYQNDETSNVTFLEQYDPEVSQTPVRESMRKKEKNRFHSSLNMGAGFSSFGNYEFLLPEFAYQVSDKFQMSFGFGVMYSNNKYPYYSKQETTEYQNLRAITNYYKAEAQYQASEKLLLVGSIIYAQNRISTPGSKQNINNDAYICTFGAQYNITPSFSIGIEVQQSKNMYPIYGGYGYPYYRY